MTIRKYIGMGLIISFGLSACTTTSSHVGVEHREAIDDANRKQIVSTTALEGAPKMHPAMSAAAILRYLDGEVKETEESGGFSSGGEGGSSN